MNEATAESGIEPKRKKPESSSIEDDAYRMKVTELRDGVLQVLSQQGIHLEPGIPNGALLVVLSQTIGNSSTMTYVEDLRLNWRDEYRRIVKQIAVMMPDTRFDTDTEPDAIVKSIKKLQAA